ncbi:hypothetical protein FB390_1822 [Nocardia bhagyanarayanae]|uniref:Uncharacterized protein n=1 Tax=Nocardia bhagyanarayanae TaxID=1215925 RepID=A0A543F8R4_9NOCA|nr:hypothetical protein FB390_1822 [Nocardia bhagyanarayanae]
MQARKRRRRPAAGHRRTGRLPARTPSPLALASTRNFFTHSQSAPSYRPLLPVAAAEPAAWPHRAAAKPPPTPRPRCSPAEPYFIWGPAKSPPSRRPPLEPLEVRRQAAAHLEPRGYRRHAAAPAETRRNRRPSRRRLCTRGRRRAVLDSMPRRGLTKPPSTPRPRCSPAEPYFISGPAKPPPRRRPPLEPTGSPPSCRAPRAPRISPPCRRPRRDPQKSPPKPPPPLYPWSPPSSPRFDAPPRSHQAAVHLEPPEGHRRDSSTSSRPKATAKIRPHQAARGSPPSRPPRRAQRSHQDDRLVHPQDGFAMQPAVHFTYVCHIYASRCRASRETLARSAEGRERQTAVVRLERRLRADRRSISPHTSSPHQPTLNACGSDEPKSTSGSRWIASTRMRVSPCGSRPLRPAAPPGSRWIASTRMAVSPCGSRLLQAQLSYAPRSTAYLRSA